MLLKQTAFGNFGSLLIYYEIYVYKMKELIQEFKVKKSLNDNNQINWEYLKYEIQEFTINYSNNIAKKYTKRRIDFERKMKQLENLLVNDESLNLYNDGKIELNSIYDHIAEGI